MKSITERVKYIIANDVAFGKNLAIATDCFCEDFCFSVKAAKTVSVISFERSSICNFRKAFKSINNVSYKKIESTEEISEKYDTLILSEDMEKFIPKDGLAKICDTVIMPIATKSDKKVA